MSNISERRTPRKPRGKSLTIGGQTFATKAAAKQFIKDLLRGSTLREPVAEPDHLFLLAPLSRHPDAAEKIGSGVHHFTVEPAMGGTRCFYLTRADGTRTDFSTAKCLRSGE